MTSRTVVRALATAAALGLAAGLAAAEVVEPCPSPPFTPAWGQELTNPPSIVPGPTRRGGQIDTTLVIREKDHCVPIWTTGLCKQNGAPCALDSDCADNAPAGSCADAGICVKTSASCGPNNPCPNKEKCAGTWAWQQQTLRTYGFPKDPKKPVYPKDPNDPNLEWGFPGPTLRARSQQLANPNLPPGPANPETEPGTRIKIGLHNYLEKTTFQDAMRCNDASFPACEGTTTSCTKDADCDSGVKCVPTQLPQDHPECFHGDNVTNLHYHGSHVSPQPHQDYVLLSLFPFGSSGVPTGRDEYALGMYQTDINPLPWNQAPGSHWYHPHKHGSTSLQVLNGLSGALIITGAFDDWLNDRMYAGQPLADRVLVVQQIIDNLNFFNLGVPNYPPQPLLNGLATPVIRMKAGEVQRWRFIGATMQASAALEIGFDERIKNVFQIAQDGVQFAWQNYHRQPYRDQQGTYKNFKLYPGNRADFLVQAPVAAGTYSVTSRIVVKKLAKTVEAVVGPELPAAQRVPPTIPQSPMMMRREESPRPPFNPVDGKPLLFTIEVVASEEPPMTFPATQPVAEPEESAPPMDPACAAAPKPDHCWPDMPSYLDDLPAPADEPRQIAFSMDGDPGALPNSFYINNTQYDASCAGATMARDSVEDWLVTNVPGKNNTFLLPHPFHIHINPFQVLRNGDNSYEKPYPWQDTIALPTQTTTDRPAGPIWNNADAEAKCKEACEADNATWNGQWTTTKPGILSVCGCIQKQGSVQIRHRFDDYTGGYVIHCHFLGHEDRGMMWNVQTTCKADQPWTYGTPQASGGPDSCAQTSSALPACK